MLYPSGVFLEVCGDESMGKTSLIEIAELLMQDTFGPWARLTETATASAGEICNAFHSYYDKQGTAALF